MVTGESYTHPSPAVLNSLFSKSYARKQSFSTAFYNKHIKSSVPVCHCACRVNPHPAWETQYTTAGIHHSHGLFRYRKDDQRRDTLVIFSKAIDTRDCKGEAGEEIQKIINKGRGSLNGNFTSSVKVRNKQLIYRSTFLFSSWGQLSRQRAWKSKTVFMTQSRGAARVIGRLLLCASIES